MPDQTHAEALAVQPASEIFAAHPLAHLATAFALGILGGLYLVVPLSLLSSMAALATLVAAIALLAKKRRKRGLRITTILVTLAMVSLGATFECIEKNNVPESQLRSLLDKGTIAVGDPVELTGVLERDPESAPERLYLFLAVEETRSRGAVRRVSGEVVLLAPVAGKSTQTEFDQLDLRYGARVRVMTVLERADSFQIGRASCRERV